MTNDLEKISVEKNSSVLVGHDLVEKVKNYVEELKSSDKKHLSYWGLVCEVVPLLEEDRPEFKRRLAVCGEWRGKNFSIFRLYNVTGMNPILERGIKIEEDIFRRAGDLIKTLSSCCYELRTAYDSYNGAIGNVPWANYSTPNDLREYAVECVQKLGRFCQAIYSSRGLYSQIVLEHGSFKNLVKKVTESTSS